MAKIREHLYDVVIVGAGPAGLAVAHTAQDAGLDALIIERGMVANSIYNFPTHMKFFSTANLLEIGSVPMVITSDKPTRLDALHYYRRFAEVKDLNMELYRNVLDIKRGEDGTFALHTRSKDGGEEVIQAKRLVLATGAYDNPRTIGVPGEDLPKVSHYYRDPHPYYQQKVLIVGGKNSAAEAALEIWRNGGEVTLSYRGDSFKNLKYWIQPDIENRIRSGEITCYYNSNVREIRPDEVVLDQQGEKIVLENDFVLLMTGYEPDVTLFDQAGIEYDPVTMKPKMDPLTFETNQPGIYLAGVICAGNISGEIFIENSRHHGELIVEHILEQQENGVGSQDSTDENSQEAKSPAGSGA